MRLYKVDVEQGRPDAQGYVVTQPTYVKAHNLPDVMKRLVAKGIALESVSEIAKMRGKPL